MRDNYAPVIEGFDLSGLVNRYSLQCEQFYVEGDNGGVLLDGSTITDALAAHVRLSWVMNSLSAAQYAALTAALNAGESPDTVRAYVFDPSCNAVRRAKFHVTRPLFQFAFDADAGQMMSFAGGELALEEASPIARFAVTPPAKTAYEYGDALDLAGLAVTQYDPDGAASDITAECTFDPASGSVLLTAGAVTLAVRYDNAPIAAIPLTVAPSEPVDGGDGWTLYGNGWLDIYYGGNMPDFWQDGGPWGKNITSVTIRDSVTRIGKYAFSDCRLLTSVAIPDSVRSVRTGAFRDCDNLSGVTIGNNVTSIEDSAFYHCDRLESVTIGDRVQTIGGYAFSNCPLLASVAIPDSVRLINSYAFWSCPGLLSVTIGVGVTFVGEYAFSACFSLTDVYYGGSRAQWGAIDIRGNNEPLTNATIHYTELPE